MPWSELTEELAEILIEDAIERADEKGVRLDRAALSAAAKRRAAELVGVAVDDDYSNGNFIFQPEFDSCRHTRDREAIDRVSYRWQRGRRRAARAGFEQPGILRSQGKDAGARGAEREAARMKQLRLFPRQRRVDWPTVGRCPR
jgi:hypothetical protein